MSSPYDYPNGNPGGFHNPNRTTQTPKVNKVKWTPENDRKLLMFFMDRNVATFELPIIAAHFPEAPSIKAIQERVVKLRAEQKGLLGAKGIVPRNDALHPANMQEVIATINDNSDVGDTHNPGPKDSTIDSGTSGVFISPYQTPATAINNFSNGHKPYANPTPVNKRPHSSTFSSNDTVHGNAPGSSTVGPPTKKIRIDQAEPVVPAILTGRPEPSFDWMGPPEVQKQLREYGEKVHKTKLAKKAAGRQEGEPTTGVGTGGQKDEAGLLTHTTDGAGTGGEAAGVEDNRAARDDPEA